MLRTALGPAIGGWLDDASVGEVMLNPDGRLWIDRLAGGLEDTGERLSAADGERIIRLVAHHVGAEVHPGSPRVSAELPGTGERFEGLLPPVVAGPAFAIRRPAVAVFTLSDYVAAGIMSERQAEVLREAVAGRANILVAGGTSTGKTTLVNALLAEVAKTSDRVVLIEDTRELQCAAPNLVALRTKDGAASPDRPRPLGAAAAARSHPDRRGARWRGARPDQGLGHRPSRRRRHAARRLRAGRAAAAGAARPGGGGHCAPRADRRDHRYHRRPRRPRLRPPARRTRPRRKGLGAQGDYRLTPAGDHP